MVVVLVYEVDGDATLGFARSQDGTVDVISIHAFAAEVG